MKNKLVFDSESV